MRKYLCTKSKISARNISTYRVQCGGIIRPNLNNDADIASETPPTSQLTNQSTEKKKHRLQPTVEYCIHFFHFYAHIVETIDTGFAHDYRYNGIFSFLRHARGEKKQKTNTSSKFALRFRDFTLARTSLRKHNSIKISYRIRGGRKKLI